MRHLYIISILIILISCDNSHEVRLIVPNWEKGDYRYIKTTTTLYSRVKQDTIFNMKSGNLYKLSVMDKSRDFYLVEFVKLTKPDFAYNMGIDSLRNNFKHLVGLLQSFPKISIPYKVKISMVGEIKEIVDWKNVLNRFTLKMFEIADSIGFKPEEHEFIKQYFNSSFKMGENLRNTLLKDLPDIFEVYNIPIPKDSAVTKHLQVQEPETGQKIDAKVEYRTLSIINGIYEIEMKTDIGDGFATSKDYIEEFFNKKNKGKSSNSKMDNYSVFYWNSNTSWIDSSKSFIDRHTDTFEIKMRTNTLIYK